MNNEKSWLTCKEASVLLNYTQRHIINLIKKGKLSADKDEDGKYYIQKSEFFRVYPHAMMQETAGTKEKLSENYDMKLMEEKIRHLQEMMAEKNKQNEFLTEQLTNFTQEKLKMLDAITSHTRLLEFKETNDLSQNEPKEIFSDIKGLLWKWPFKKR